MAKDKPLHVRVAEALVIADRVRNPLRRIVFDRVIPAERYDTDWSATGPLIEKYGIGVFPLASNAGVVKKWIATDEHADKPDEATDAKPLIAVCHLILALKEAGKL